MASPEDSPLRLNRRFSPFVPRQRAQEPVAAGRFFLCAIRPHGVCRAADCEKPPGATRITGLSVHRLSALSETLLFSPLQQPQKDISSVCFIRNMRESWRAGRLLWIAATMPVAVNIPFMSRFPTKKTPLVPQKTSFKNFHKIKYDSIYRMSCLV